MLLLLLLLLLLLCYVSGKKTGFKLAKKSQSHLVNIGKRLLPPGHGSLSWRIQATGPTGEAFPRHSQAGWANSFLINLNIFAGEIYKFYIFTFV
jgi:hypothetical protein